MFSGRGAVGDESVSDIDRLRRAYRWLMWAYPRAYRQERGTELMTTLLDDATPGRRRPTLAEAVDLIRGGLRARLRPPRHPALRVVTGLVAVYLAVIGAAVGVLVTGFPGAPSEDAGIAAAAVALPRPPHNVPAPAIRCETTCPEWDGRDDVLVLEGSLDRDDMVVIFQNPPAERIPGVVAQARDRLAAHGWQVTPIAVDDSFSSFEAVDGRLRLTFTAWTGDDRSAAPGDYRPAASVRVSVSKVFPASMIATVMIVGCVVGLALGWLVAASALRRFQRHHLARRAAIVTVASPLLILAPLLSLGAVWVLIVSSIVDPPMAVHGPLLLIPGGWTSPMTDSQPSNFYSAAWTWLLFLAAAVPALSATAALGLTHWPDRRSRGGVPQVVEVAPGRWASKRQGSAT